MSAARSKLRIILAVAGAVIGAMGLAAPPASALDVSYCSQFVSSGYDCYASKNVAHTFNYNRNAVSSYSNNACAFITPSNNGPSNWIYGSGCAPGDRYAFCHAPVVNYYYAVVKHLNDAGGRTLYGYAQTGKDCSTGWGLKSKRSRAKARAASASAKAELARRMGAFRRASDQAPSLVRGLVAAENQADPAGAIDVAEARRVNAAKPVFVMPKRDGVCAALQVRGDATAIGCTDLDHVDASIKTTRTHDGWTVWGAVTDGVSSIEVTEADGTVTRVPVRGNGFSADFAEQPTAAAPVA